MTAPGFRPSASRRKLSTIMLGGTEQSSNTWSTCARVKRGLLLCQNRPTLAPKEMYTLAHSCHLKKRPKLLSKETYTRVD
jgi:hypothetical protein